MYSKEEGTFHTHVGRRFSLSDGNKEEVFAGVVESIFVEKCSSNAKKVHIIPRGGRGKFVICIVIYNDKQETNDALWKLFHVDQPEAIYTNLRLNLYESERSM